MTPCACKPIWQQNADGQYVVAVRLCATHAGDYRTIAQLNARIVTLTAENAALTQRLEAMAQRYGEVLAPWAQLLARHQARVLWRAGALGPHEVI